MLGKVKTEQVEPEQLDFDLQNPRLTEELGPPPKNEIDMIALFSTNEDLPELLRSIAQNGYLPFDDMVVMKKDDGRYTVLEGNRRLAAIRLFKDPDLRARLKIQVPALSEEVEKTLATIPVKTVASRAEARGYIGFKHINGPHKWDALSKAKYAMDWLQSGGSLGEIARAFGDTHNTVSRLLNGLQVLEQAKKAGFTVEDVNRRRFAFSHLYTALSQAGYRSYLGLSDAEMELGKDPVPRERAGNLKQLMLWLYGSKSQRIDPIIASQNPDLGRLNKVLGRSKALSILEHNNDLDKAYDEVEPPAKRFVAALVQAYSYTDEALRLVSDYDGSDEGALETCGSLVKKAQAILQLLAAQPAPRTRRGKP